MLSVLEIRLITISNLFNLQCLAKLWVYPFREKQIVRVTIQQPLMCYSQVQIRYQVIV